MLSRLFSVLFFAYVAVTTILFYVTAVLIRVTTQLFDRRLVFLHLATCCWGASYLWVNPAWSVWVTGREHIRKGVTYVVVSNHQSMLDILLGFRLLFPFKWVAKAELFKLPFVGWGMSLNRYIKLKRGDVASVRRMLEDCEKTLAEGNSVYLFPEGTRSETGKVKRFRPGAFTLAKKMNVSILPVVISGATDALPKRSLVIRGKHHITVKVLEEIPYERFADTPVEALSEQVQRLIAAEVERGEAAVEER